MKRFYVDGIDGNMPKKTMFKQKRTLSMWKTYVSWYKIVNHLWDAEANISVFDLTHQICYYHTMNNRDEQFIKVEIVFTF